MRDELQDALLAGEFEDSTQPTKLKRLMELTIRSADELRPTRMIVLMSLTKGKRPPFDPEEESINFELDKANPQDKPRLMALWSGFITPVINHVLIGSWSGLLLKPARRP